MSSQINKFCFEIVIVIKSFDHCLEFYFVPCCNIILILTFKLYRQYLMSLKLNQGMELNSIYSVSFVTSYSLSISKQTKMKKTQKVPVFSCCILSYSIVVRSSQSSWRHRLVQQQQLNILQKVVLAVHWCWLSRLWWLLHCLE